MKKFANLSITISQLFTTPITNWQHGGIILVIALSFTFFSQNPPSDWGLYTSGLWEEGFRTHGDMFRSQGVNKPIAFGAGSGNEVAVLTDPDDADAFVANLQSAETAEAMQADGVKRETVKVFVLDKELQV